MRIAAALVALTWLLACGSPTWQQAKTSNKARKHVMVQFTDSTLHPSEAHVLPGGNVVWINYSTGYVGSVFLSSDTAAQLGCSGMRPLFAEVAGGYQSTAIAEDSENVELPCSPPPGSYPYELRLSEGELELENYDRVMHGSIAVGAGD